MEKCLIYLLTGNKCRKQYVGQTDDTFRYRWNYYRSNSKYAHGISCMQEHLYEHFCDREHTGFLNDVLITFTDKTHPTNPLQRENYWKHTLKTFSPYGLNIKENMQLFHCLFAFAGIGIVCVVVAALYFFIIIIIFTFIHNRKRFF